MSGVLQSVYGFFLQQATAVAAIANYQLAFQRQEASTSFIQADYWTAPHQATQGPTPSRRTAAAPPVLRGCCKTSISSIRYAFQTEKRKLQLSTTISLAQLDPYQFQRFRETGVLSFVLPMQLFDREFPGHYLRLIRRVRTSVVALVPPTRGIRATLANTGVTRVVVGGDLYQSVIVRRESGARRVDVAEQCDRRFQLDPQSDLLLPFEGLGVEGAWEFRMPKASNPLDYRSIADVLITIDYAAMNSFDYEQQVIASLSSRVSQNRGFSFRVHLADAWYDLHNPDQTATPMTVRFRIGRADFPPNVDRLRIQLVF